MASHAAEPIEDDDLEADALMLALEVRKARRHVTELFWLGIVLMVLGLGFAVGEWPHTDYYDNGTATLGQLQTGDQGAANIGLAFAGAGQLFALVAIIAWGVRYGIESARRD